MRYHLPLFAVLALSTGAAFAHADFLSSTPENRERVTSAPSEIELVFSERLEVAFSTFRVYALPENLAQAEADTALRENTMPLGDTDDDQTDDHGDDHGNEQDDDHGDDHADTAGDDDGHDSTDDTGDDSGHDQGDDPSQGGLSAFVTEMLETEDDEAAHEGGDVTTQGAQVSIALASDLEPGWYVVMWRALSADEHPVEGYVTFNYQP
jgi:methionine-rich copper-binding protein CopC